VRYLRLVTVPRGSELPLLASAVLLPSLGCEQDCDRMSVPGPSDVDGGRSGSSVLGTGGIVVPPSALVSSGGADGGLCPPDLVVEIRTLPLPLHL
jgi:hypothetical protein